MIKLKECLSFIGLLFITAVLVVVGLATLAYSAFITMCLFVITVALSTIATIIGFLIVGYYSLYKKLFKKRKGKDE
jgi:uncharacterized membrane protein